MKSQTKNPIVKPNLKIQSEFRSTEIQNFYDHLTIGLDYFYLKKGQRKYTIL